MSGNNSPAMFRVRPTHWQDHAACVGVSRKVFFPQLERGQYIGDIYNRARLICATCPVRQTCLDVELTMNYHGVKPHGMFGGKSPRERLAMIRLEGWKPNERVQP